MSLLTKNQTKTLIKCLLETILISLVFDGDLLHALTHIFLMNKRMNYVFVCLNPIISALRGVRSVQF